MPIFVSLIYPFFPHFGLVDCDEIIQDLNLRSCTWRSFCPISYSKMWSAHSLCRRKCCIKNYSRVDVEMFRLGSQGFVFKKCKNLFFLILLHSYMESKRFVQNICAVWFFQDPFLVISKYAESGVLVPVCKTEVLKNDHHPKWQHIFLSIQQVGSKVHLFCVTWASVKFSLY